MKRFLSVDLFSLFLILLVWAAATAVSGTDPTGLAAALRLLLGVVIVMIVPGYAIQAAIFPRNKDQDGWTRLVFSFGFSIVIIPILALILNASTVGIHFSTMVGGVCFVFLAAALIATILRSRLPEAEWPSAAIGFPPINTWISGNRTNRILQIIIIAAIGVAGISAAYVYQHPILEGYTEFYIVERPAVGEGDPRSVTAGDPWTVGIGIVNREGQAGQYRILAMSDDGKALGEIGPFLLVDGADWQGEMILTVDGIGENRSISFLLERIGFAWPYRSLRLWINVLEKEIATPEGTASPVE
jgi:uncharacterized membrane protein